MPSSDVLDQPTTAFVWVWLPEATEPVVAGRVDQVAETLVFTYGQTYLARPDAVPLYLPELPLRAGQQMPRREAHGVIADAAPDSWGRRVIAHRRFGLGIRSDTDLRLLTYLMGAGSDRIGALDFQESATGYVARNARAASLEDLMAAAGAVETGSPLPPELVEPLLRGTSIGGARPKALLDDGDRRLIAKFSSTTDVFPMVQAEFVAMRLASLAGMNVAPVELVEVMGRSVLLVERFDRLAGGRRRAVISALTVLGLHETEGRYGSYADLADIVRARFTDPKETLRELFSRITFNILVSNTDDHARNQAAFWDGEWLTLTPAYDISPYPRSGQEAEQVMAIGRDGWRYSQVAGCVQRAVVYHLSEAEAQDIVDRQIDTIETHWDQVCDEARLTRVARENLWQVQFINPFSLLTSH